MGGAAVAGLSRSVAPALFGNYLPTRLSDLPAVLFGLMAIQVVANPIGINPQLRAGFRALAIKITPGGPQSLPSHAPPAKARELASGAQK
jgi:hypothetical protein